MRVGCTAEDLRMRSVSAWDTDSDLNCAFCIGPTPLFIIWWLWIPSKYAYYVMFLSFLCVELSYGHLTSVWYSGLVSASQTQISLCHNLLLGCQIILRFVQSTIISRFGTLVLHINAEKPLRLDFHNLYYLFFPDFMFENLELTCHLTSFHDEFIVAPSGWKPPDADAHQFAGKARKYCKIVRLVPKVCKLHSP